MSTLTLTFKGKTLKVIALHQGSMTIGSDPASDIHIDSLAVQPKHATIITNGSESVLTDAGTQEGTFVNSQRIEQHRLADQDDIHIGKHNLLFTLGALETSLTDVPADKIDSPDLKLEPKDNGPPPTAFLQIMSGQNMGKTIKIKRKLTNLGKPGVQTAVIAHRNDGFFISHLEGELPPQVNGEPIGDQAHLLQDGDTIKIGNVKMQFYLA